MMLTAAGLTLAVPGRTLVSGFDLRLAPGDCCAVLGRNGAGKTSLLLALAGLRTPESGTVTLGDAPIGSQPRREVARRVGILLQDETESFWGTTLEYAALGRFAHAPAPFGADPSAEAAARAALAEVDLAEHADQPYRTLSGGERQRARIAQLLVQAPAGVAPRRAARPPRPRPPGGGDAARGSPRRGGRRGDHGAPRAALGSARLLAGGVAV